MLEGNNLLETDFTLNMLNAEGEYIPVNAESNFTHDEMTYNLNITPCLPTNLQVHVSNDYGNSTMQYTIASRSAWEVAFSSFDLLSPKKTKIVKLQEMIKISWEPSVCATSYILEFKSNETIMEKNTTQNFIEIEHNLLAGCTKYDVTIIATISPEKFSEKKFIGVIDITPEAIHKIVPILLPSSNNIIVRWEVDNALACIKEYRVYICPRFQFCESHLITKNKNLPYILYNSPNKLKACYNYYVTINTHYNELSFMSKHFNFQTLSHEDADGSTAPKNLIAKYDDTSNTVNLSFDSVHCVDHYQINKIIDGTERKYDQSKESHFIIDKVYPCTHIR